MGASTPILEHARLTTSALAFHSQFAYAHNVWLLSNLLALLSQLNDGGVGVHHNSFTTENTGRLEHRYKRQYVVHSRNKLWSLEEAVILRRQTHAGS